MLKSDPMSRRLLDTIEQDPGEAPPESILSTVVTSLWANLRARRQLDSWIESARTGKKAKRERGRQKKTVLAIGFLLMSWSLFYSSTPLSVLGFGPISLQKGDLVVPLIGNRLDDGMSRWGLGYQALAFRPEAARVGNPESVKMPQIVQFISGVFIQEPVFASLPECRTEVHIE